MKVLLGDLRHKTIGAHSMLVPLGIGYVAAYAKDRNAIEIRMRTDPELALQDITDWQPDVIGLANFVWNAGLNEMVYTYAKELNPKVVTVGGGPEFSTGCDFYAYYEGEVAFTELIRNLIAGMDAPHRGFAPGGVPLPRIKNLDTIPSPYLAGLLDQWLDGTHIPIIQTTRGCPYSCGFCKEGADDHRTVARFSLERVKEELNYIADKLPELPELQIADSNFGLSRHDEDVAMHLRWLQDNRNWWPVIKAGTHRVNDRVVRIASIVRNKLVAAGSLQSLNEETLHIISRENVPFEEYCKHAETFKKQHNPLIAELIVPLPAETKKSFFTGVRKMMGASINNFYPYTLMFLKGTAICEMREKYSMVSRFRLLPNQFGEYNGKKVFELEEVCVATNTMSFEDYLDCRGFMFVCLLLMDARLGWFRQDIDDYFSFAVQFWEELPNTDTTFARIYKDFMLEAKTELWDTREAFVEHFSKDENYELLLQGNLGDNLFRKYRAIGFISLIDTLYEAAK